MINVQPISVTAANLTSDVAITETEWTAGTYATGVRRYVGIDLYEVTATPDTTDEPTVGAAKDPATWVLVGQINRHRMFNNVLSQPTVQSAAPITVAITTTQLVNSVAFFGMDAAEVNVTVTDDTDGEIYNRTIDLVQPVSADFYEWFFSPILRSPEAVFLDLPAYSGATIGATISGTAGDDVEVGEMAIGTQRSIGDTKLNYTTGYRDFSRRERNEFGDFLPVVARPVARVGSFEVFMPKTSVPAVVRLLSDLRAAPTVFVGGEDDPDTIFFGFSDEPQILRVGPGHSVLSLEIVGLT